MVKNLASNVEFYCLNPVHPEPILMKLREHADDVHDDFFACPKYMMIDDNHPDGHLPDEKACMNRLSLADAGDIISQFNKVVDADLANGCMMEYANYTFKYRTSIVVKVLSYGGSVLKFGILNKRAVNN